MSNHFIYNIPINQLNVTHDVMTFFIYAEGSNRYVSTLSWDPMYHQLYMHQKEAVIKMVYLSFDGEVKTPNISTQFTMPDDFEAPIQMENGPSYYLTSDLKVNADYGVKENNSYIRINNCSLLFEQFKDGLCFDLNCQFNGDFSKGEGGVIILGTYDQISNHG